MYRRDWYKFHNPEDVDVPAWGVVLLWPLQAAVLTGCLILAAALGSRIWAGELQKVIDGEG